MRVATIFASVVLFACLPEFSHSQQHAFERVDLRNAHTRVIQQPDGSLTALISSAPLHYMRDGAWLPIVEAWQTTQDGPRNADNVVDTTLPHQADGRIVLRHGETSLAWRAHSLELSPGVELAPAAAIVEIAGNVAQYDEVWPGVSERYTALPGKLKHETILQAAPLDCDTLRLSYEFEDADLTLHGSTVRIGELIMDPVFATDASGRRSRVEGSYVVDGARLTLEIPGAWLLDASRVYPVVIDPTLGPATPAQDTLIGSAFPTMSTYTEAEIYVQNNGTEEERSLIQFDVSAIPDDATINSASMNLRVTTVTMAGSAPIDVALRMMLRSWGADTTWNIATTTANWNTAGAKGATDSAPSAFTSQTVAAAVGTTVSYDVLAPVAQWTTGGVPNHGLLLSVDTPTPTFNDRAFGSREHATAANRPTLTVNYSGGTGGSTPNPGAPFGGGGGGGGGCVATPGAAAGVLVFALLVALGRRQS